MKHHEAILIALLRHPNKWVPLPYIHEFTKKHCQTECYHVNTRISDLRTKYGYNIENIRPTVGGVVHSQYRIRISEAAINVLRRQYRPGYIPHYSKVTAEVSPTQKTIFNVEYQ